MRGGIDPGEHRFRPRVVGVVYAWRIPNPGMGFHPRRVRRGPRRCPEGRLSQRAGSMSPSQSTTSGWGWGFHTVRGGTDPGHHCFRPRAVGDVHV